MSIALCPNFVASDAAGFNESLDVWSLRTQIPDDWAERLALAWCWSLIVTAAWITWAQARTGGA